MKLIFTILAFAFVLTLTACSKTNEEKAIETSSLVPETDENNVKVIVLGELEGVKKISPPANSLDEAGFGKLGDYLRLTAFADRTEYEILEKEKWIEIKEESVLVEKGSPETWLWVAETKTIKVSSEGTYISKAKFNKQN